MDISRTIQELKKDPAFKKNVGMILIHNGVVRGWSRVDHAEVTKIEIKVNYSKIDDIIREFEQKQGIYKIVVEAHEGIMDIGDDVLFIIVAGDIRENVKATLSDVLDAIKSQAITKKETKN